MQADYIDHMGSDLRVVNAARVSMNKESTWDQKQLKAFNTNDALYQEVLKTEDAKLIKYLATHGHWTPFAHPQITMRETVPIFVARQRFKHMIGFTYNEVSRRYVDDTPEFLFPEEWRSRPEASIKQGSAGIHRNDSYWQGHYFEHASDCMNLYMAMISDGVAPEQARMVLPQSMLTSYYVTGSLAAWARAYKQRIDPHAQKEIRDLAEQWGSIIQPLFPVSWAALTSSSIPEAPAA